MKKCILLFLSFCCLFLISLGANASILPNELNSNVLFMNDIVNINVFKPCPDSLIKQTVFYKNVCDTIKYTKMHKGGYNFECEVCSTDNKLSFYIDVLLSVESDKLTNINAKINDNVIYNCDFINETPKTTISKEIDLWEYFNVDNIYFSCYPTGHLYYNDNSNCENEYYADADEIGEGFLIGGIYSKNTKYEDKDLYYVTNIDDPLTQTEILSSVNVEDLTEGNITNKAFIETNEYILDSEEKIKAGTYKIKLVASDSVGNITVQPAYVAVCDINAPTINTFDKVVEYTDKIDDIDSLYTIYDNSGSYEITEFVDNYSSSYNIVGNHEIIITAKDSSDNYATKTININVVDRKAPVLAIKNVTATTTAPINSIDDLYQYVTCEDEIDKNPKVIIDKDSSDYFSKRTTPGVYKFKVIGKDEYENSIEDYLTITVTDSDFPIISVNDYVIKVNVGEKLTKDQIANILLQTGQISSLDNLELKSAYFDSPDVAGEYDLIVSTPDKVFKNVISVNKTNSSNQDNNSTIIDTIDYSIPTKNENKDNTNLYIICASVGIIIILSLGFVLYKRKH